MIDILISCINVVQGIFNEFTLIKNILKLTKHSFFDNMDFCCYLISNFMSHINQQNYL